MLSRVFRGMLVRLMEKAARQGLLKLLDELPDFAPIKSKCYEKNWMVYCQRPFANHQRLIEYLGSYTHRVAIFNNRIKALDEGKVRFAYKDNRRGGTSRHMTLDALEFIRRFLTHVLPKGFYKIRYFGFIAI